MSRYTPFDALADVVEALNYRSHKVFRKPGESYDAPALTLVEWGGGGRVRLGNSEVWLVTNDHWLVMATILPAATAATATEFKREWSRLWQAITDDHLSRDGWDGLEVDEDEDDDEDQDDDEDDDQDDDEDEDDDQDDDEDEDDDEDDELEEEEN